VVHSREVEDCGGAPQKVSIAHDGFHLLRKLSVVATLITKVLFNRVLSSC